MLLENLVVIGNCQFSALISNTGAVVWCCLPRFDSQPVFSTLLDHKEGGQFNIGPPDGSEGTLTYIENTNIAQTEFDTPSGSFRIIDFAPRFLQYDRIFRPTQLCRIIEPIKGNPQIIINSDPKIGWSKITPEKICGSNHIKYEGFESQLRLTSDIPVTYLLGQPFALTEKKHLILSWGTPVEEPLLPLCNRFYEETKRYWQRWVKQCNIPQLFQKEVIRSALALRLHCFEDTGAIIASMTTSIPESAKSGRNWDYRYCWLRDSYYVLEAFRLLGQFEERENFTNFLLNIAGSSLDLDLLPLYKVDGSIDLKEEILGNWAGFNDDGPVRVGNNAALQTQNDIFGEMVLSLLPIFLDERFSNERTPFAFKLLESLAEKAITVAGKPDAGIWEFRTDAKPQTFSSLMSWAASDRMAEVAKRYLPGKKEFFASASKKIKQEILDQAWNESLGCFTGTYGGTEVDASLLQMASLRFLPPDNKKLQRSIEKTWKSLSRNGWLLRYSHNDGFGNPESAFLICTFWLIEALDAVGRKDEAKLLINQAQMAISPLGLLSEDFDTVNLKMWGNFPQTYSHVGFIHAAFAASPRWNEV
ncbi:MAG: glycoside hydrolase family 15 protein [Proteobacteria bacterium]|nr:glycoside hydrolase family 15 protein [Pseudomonadota bacterium]